MPEVSVIDHSLDFTSRYYLIESIDAILDVFGNNCILRGCDINNINFDSERKILTFEISEGLVIADKKLIKFPEKVLMEIDLSAMDITNGKLAVVISYRYLRTSRPNLAVISIKYIDSNNNCSEWWEELDKVILTVLEYDESTSNFIKYESDFMQDKKIMINNKEMVSKKFDYIMSNLRNCILTLNNL